MMTKCKMEESVMKGDRDFDDDEEEEARKPRNVAKNEVKSNLENDCRSVLITKCEPINRHREPYNEDCSARQRSRRKRRRSSSSSRSSSPNLQRRKRETSELAAETMKVDSAVEARENASQRDVTTLEERFSKMENVLRKHDKELQEFYKSLHVLQTKMEKQDEQQRIDRLDVLFSDCKVYIKVARKIRSNLLFTATVQEMKTLKSHRRKGVFRPGLEGVFDRHSSKGHCTITANELREAEKLLASTPSFVDGIDQLDIRCLKRFIKEAKTAVEVVEGYLN